MKSASISNFSLSADEISLSLSLVNRPDLGKAILNETYGVSLTEQQIQERLIAASHSLMARGFAWVNDKGQVELENGFEKALFPLVKFDGMIQVAISELDKVPLIRNICLGKKKFTAQSISNGVVREFSHGTNELVPDLIKEWINLSYRVYKGYTSDMARINISLKSLVEIQDESIEKAAQLLKTTKMSQPLLQAFVHDATKPKKRGSIVYSNASSEIGSNVNQNEAGASILFISGNKYDWIIKFNIMKDDAAGVLFIGEKVLFAKMIHDLVVNKK